MYRSRSTVNEFIESVAPNIAAGDPAPSPITTFLLGWVNRSGLSREWKWVPVWSVHSSATLEDSIRGHGRISHTLGRVMSVCVCVCR